MGMKFASIQDDEHSSPPLSPGMKYRHYAPKAKIRLVETKAELEEKGLDWYKKPIWTNQNLYAQLREADRKGYSHIVIHVDEAMLSNEALMNRLEKACQ
jgi:hypothetical protein